MTAKKPREKPSKVDWRTLKGKFFHNFDNEGYVRSQGWIEDIIDNRIAIVRYFDWIIGGPYWGCTAVWIDNIVNEGWRLYSSDEDMRDSYEHGGVRTRREQQPSDDVK